MSLSRFLRSPFAPTQRPTVDTGQLTQRIQSTLASAFQQAGLTAPEVPAHVRSTLDQAFAAARLRAPERASGGTIYDGTATAANDDVATPIAPPATGAERGRFTAGSFTNAAGTRSYKLYVPALAPSSAPCALVMMLHGCTQSPDDFAAGTRMNALADRHGFVVLYPAQAAKANGSRCWNWFRGEDQSRGRGEPAILAGMANEIAAAHGVDSRRVFVAGLSAGAAMAVVLGVTHPDVFAAVGAHSGLAYGAARDMQSAFAAMHGGPGAATAAHDSPRHVVPTIVFHGDRDATVRPANGSAIIAQVQGADSSLRIVRRDDATTDGTRFSRTDYVDAEGRTRAEHWVVAGLAHAWSGGSADGSYTQPSGPDASAEIVRFLLAQDAPDAR